MKFTPTDLADAVPIELEKRADERGFFARTFCAEEFAARGLATVFPQANHSRNRRRGRCGACTSSARPHGEVKLVRVVQGAIHDVIIDLRPGKPDLRRWQGFDLDAESGACSTCRRASPTASRRLRTTPTSLSASQAAKASTFSRIGLSPTGSVCQSSCTRRMPKASVSSARITRLSGLSAACELCTTRPQG